MFIFGILIGKLKMVQIQEIGLKSPGVLFLGVGI